MIKIAVSGVASSGKSTIVNDLQNILSVNYNVCAIHELVRQLTRIFNVSLDEIDKMKLRYEFEKSILESQIFFENLAIKKGFDIIICDRSVYDILVYSKMFLDEEHYNKIEQIIKKNHVYYDLLIYCEPLKFKHDGYRKNYRDKGEIDYFEEIVKPQADIILPPMEHYKRMSLLLNHKLFKKLF